MCFMGAQRINYIMSAVSFLAGKVTDKQPNRVTGLAGQEGMARAYAAAGVLCNLGIHTRACQQPHVTLLTVRSCSLLNRVKIAEQLWLHC